MKMAGDLFQRIVLCGAVKQNWNCFGLCFSSMSERVSMNTVNTMFKVMHDCYDSVILWDCVTSSDRGNLQCMEGKVN